MNYINKLLFFAAVTFFVLLQSVALADRTSLEQAKKLYQQNKYPEAIELLETAIAQYESQDNAVKSVIALRNLALIYQKVGKWQQAESNLDRAEKIAAINDKARHLRPQILEVRGQIELSLGRSQSALATWQEAANLYQQQGNLTGYTQTEVYQAAALQTLGLYSQSIKTLTAVNQRLSARPDSAIKAQALLSIGNVLSRIGEYEASAETLKDALNIAKKLAKTNLIAEALLSLGNNAKLQKQPQRALELYRQALKLDSSLDLHLRAKLNRLDVLTELSQANTAKAEAKKIARLLERLPSQQTTVQAKVSLARHLIELHTKPNRVYHLLLDAIKEAKALNIKTIEADALGVLGSLYEQNQQLIEAEQITERALLIAQSINARELTYQWQWQLGRVLKGQGKTEGAIAAYTQATNNLQALRSDLIAISSQARYSFREQIEPVYRELAALLLHPNASQAELSQGRQIIESLQVAELDNFFREACLDVEPQNIEEIDPTAAVVYSIILPDRLAVIFSQPGKPLEYHQTAIANPQQVNKTFEDLYANLNPFLAVDNSLQPNQTFYNWLIRPFETSLQSSSSDTLVFIFDGIMRGIPVAALHDGKQYLVEKYSLALTPGLQLLTSRSLSLDRLKTIAGGITESHQGFDALPNVQKEVTKVAGLVPSEILLNQNFTRDRLQQQIASLPYPVVHLATHGQFSSSADDTFLLIWNDRINVKNLDLLLQSRFERNTPIELLILSACQTAVGDNNAALGLAGVAIRSGARSTVATLWSIKDDSTAELMTQFYQALKTPGISKSEALRQAQLSLLRSQKYQHPFYWSAFILLGNWL